jgi:hypothetical protein
MNTTAALPAITFSEEELARITGLDAWDLRSYQPDVWGSPGHWFRNDQGRQVYTGKGAEVLAEALLNAGREVAGMCLQCELKQRRETPSRSLVPGVEKNTPSPWWQRGAMA